MCLNGYGDESMPHTAAQRLSFRQLDNCLTVIDCHLDEYLNDCAAQVCNDYTGIGCIESAAMRPGVARPASIVMSIDLVGLSSCP